MKDLKLVKSGDFLGTKCDFYKDEINNVYMTRKQIGEALQYSDSRVAITKIHSRNKDRIDKFSVSTNLVSTDGKEYNTVLYNYQGIYEITFMSRKSVAEDFRDWVFNQVETIRKTGMTMPDPELAVKEVFSDLDEDLQVAIVEGYKNKLSKINKELEEAKPKVDRWEALMDSKGNLTISDFAKSLNIKNLGRNNMFNLLREKEILMKGNNKNLPYQRYINQDYFTVITTERNGLKYNVTLLTSKGIEWLYGKLQEWQIC